MKKLNKDNEIVINNLMKVKLNSVLGQSPYTSFLVNKGYEINIVTDINPNDVKKYFPDTNGFNPIQLTFNKFKSKIKAETFINDWIVNNLESLKTFEEDYRWAIR